MALREEGSRLPAPPRWVPVVLLVAVLLGVGAWLIGEGLTSSGPVHPAQRPAGAGTGFVTYQDPAGGFVGGYPSSWQRLQSDAPGVVLLATGAGGASLEVRTTPIGAFVNAANLGTAKKLTDRVVRSGKDVKFLRRPQEVTLGGLPGFLYLYTFQDPASGELGAHAHYFLFQGTRMITLVFQALPASGVLSLAPVFDRIAGTFRARPA